MIIKRLIFFGQTATHACDGRCDKAWGSYSRPTVPTRKELHSGTVDPDDYAYLSDGELGTAPIVTGITENGQNKPLDVKGPEDINAWCVGECERAWMSQSGQPDATPDLPDFSVRFYNKAPHRRDS
jgi:hypothetical protein